MTKIDGRPISDGEIALTIAILKDDVAGSEQLRIQLTDCLVYPKLPNNEILGFLVSRLYTKAEVPYGRNVAAEARALDTDGVVVEVLVHVDDGYLYELEFVKADSSPINRFPAATDLFDFQTYWPRE